MLLVRDEKTCILVCGRLFCERYNCILLVRESQVMNILCGQRTESSPWQLSSGIEEHNMAVTTTGTGAQDGAQLLLLGTDCKAATLCSRETTTRHLSNRRSLPCPLSDNSQNQTRFVLARRGSN
mmetsp:Transcript_33509/g.49616  ORF Transcript_33509/g.49616 Transcript_33509/m.49616 type:complete len:124 (-) Transcript_33509:575-946(-)